MDHDYRDVSEIARPDEKLLLLYVLRCLLAGPVFLVVFPYCYFKYHTLRYRFDDEGITMSWGLLWRREIFLTYARIQDIHLSRGLIERWLGLGTIHIQTAAGSSGSEMAIVGLRVYQRVRDFLYLRMRGARFGDQDAAEVEGAGPEAVEAGAGDDEVLALLTEIRDEVRALGARLAGERS